MALSVNPLIAFDFNQGSHRLQDIVSAVGWETAKDEFDEVRRLLQHMGQTVREYDEDFWLNILLRKAAGAAKLNMPVVVTDVRYRNEALALRAAGFKLVRITRPGAGSGGVSALHASETALDDFRTDLTITNGGSLKTLNAMIAAVAER
jgi:hypothetical protein